MEKPRRRGSDASGFYDGNVMVKTCGTSGIYLFILYFPRPLDYSNIFFHIILFLIVPPSPLSIPNQSIFIHLYFIPYPFLHFTFFTSLSFLFNFFPLYPSRYRKSLILSENAARETQKK